MTCKYKVKIKDIQYNYKVQMTDIQSKYKFKVFCTGYDDSEIKEKIDAMYQAWPKVSGEGETITLNDTANTTMAIDLKGNTIQDGEPTPDAPVEIQVVSGDNSIDVCGKNLFDKNSITPGYIDKNGNVGFDGTNSTSDFILIPSGATNLVRTTLKNSAFYDKDKVFISREYLKSLPVPNNAKYIRIQVNNDNLNNEQLEVGSTATTYEPYQSQTYEVDLPVENLFDKDNANVLNGNLVSSSSITSSASNRIFYINCQPNTTYTVQKAVGNYFVLGTTSSTPTIGGSYSQKTMDNTATKISITTDANAKYLICWYWNNGDTLTEEQTKATIQVELGTKANHYTEYGTTPIELCKIGDYKDRIYPLNGKWYLHKEIGRYDFTGTDNFSASQWGTNSWALFNIIATTFNTNELQIMSNLFKGVPYANRGTGGNNIIYTIGNNGFEIRNTTYSTLTDIRNATKGSYIYWVLATPTTEEITDSTLISQLEEIKEAESYSGQTNISQTNDDKPFILTATALKDLSSL